MVLATLVLIVTSSVTIASLASSLKVGRDLSSRIEVADHMLDAAQGPIQHWLSTKSAQAVLSVDNSSPAVGILHDVWSVDDHNVRLQITAFDLQGMVPLDAISAGSSLRRTLPVNILTALDQPTDGAGRITGLDELAQIDPDDPILVFPVPLSVPITTFGGVDATSVESVEARSSPRTPAIGDFIAVSPLPPSDKITININTAPLNLLEAALRDSGTDAISVIRAHRAESQLAPVPPAHGPLRFIGASSLWGVRIDMHVDNVHRAWWEIYQQHAGGPAGWRCIQRLAITE